MRLIIIIIFSFSFPLQAITSSTSSETVVNETKTLFRDTPYSLHISNGSKWYLEGDELTHVKYIGEVKNDIPHGYGEIYLKGKKEFSGNYINGLKDEGTYSRVGYTYTGEFKNNLQNGQGKEIISEESVMVYEGGFKDGYRHGQGTYTNADGLSYEGEWVNGELNGYGIYNFPNGRKYEGNYKDSKRNGQGTFTWPNGESYQGGWKDDQYNGRGNHIYINGGIYIGDHKKNKKHGYGIEIFPNSGQMQWGEYIKDVFHDGIIFNNSIGTIKDKGKSVITSIEKRKVISNTIKKLNEFRLFEQIFIHDPSVMKKIYLIAIESMNSNRKKLMAGSMPAEFIAKTPFELLELISNFKFEEATILLETIKTNKRPSIKIKEIEHKIGDLFAYNFDINDAEQSQLKIKELGEDIEIKIINKPSWLSLSIDKSQKPYIAKLRANEDIKEGEFFINYIITDNFLGYKKYNHKKLTVNPATNTYKGYGFLLESSETELPSECFDALKKGVLINLPNSENESYLNLKKEYYYYKGDLFSFRLGSLSWKKNKKYFICEKIHINQKAFIEYTTRQVEIPAN